MLNGSVRSKHLCTKELIMGLSSKIRNLRVFVMRKEFLRTSILLTHLNNMVWLKKEERTIIEATRTMLNGKLDAKADDGYFLRYLLVSKAAKLFNTRRQQVKETFHVTFDESIEAIRKKRDEHGRNIARLVVHGYRQEEGIGYDERFAHVARMKAIRIFLAYATYMNFRALQMDVKSVFLNEKLKEQVYVQQPHGFESSEFTDYEYSRVKEMNAGNYVYSDTFRVGGYDREVVLDPHSEDTNATGFLGLQLGMTLRL
ncbi:retrovirus-related pol polyprotein from transposon TNT 1-94 [Tanacetum coccineum]